MCERDEAREVDIHLRVKFCHVDLAWLGEVISTLDSRIQKDAIEIRVGVRDTTIVNQQLPNPEISKSCEVELTQPQID